MHELEELARLTEKYGCLPPAEILARLDAAETKLAKLREKLVLRFYD